VYFKLHYAELHGMHAYGQKCADGVVHQRAKENADW